MEITIGRYIAHNSLEHEVANVHFLIVANVTELKVSQQNQQPVRNGELIRVTLGSCADWVKPSWIDDNFTLIP